MAEEARWYVAHTYSGYENTVKATIEKAVENRNMGDLILEVNIPMETVTEVTRQRPARPYERKVFPGYVLVKMVMTDDDLASGPQRPRRDRASSALAATSPFP